jgi:hypothetical protein
LKESRQVAIKTITKQQSNLAKWVHQRYKQKSFAFGDHVQWFMKSRKTHHGKFKW